MIKDRSGNNKAAWVVKGAKRAAGDKGHRVWICMGNNGGFQTVSVYPQDARKFAMQLLRVADECEPK